MPTTSMVSISDGARVTVSDLIANPMIVPTKLKELMTNVFVSSTLLRDAGPNAAGVVAYTEGDPSFLDRDVEELAEGAEIPVAAGRRGLPKSAYGVKRALGVRVTKEIRIENNVGAVERQMLQFRNTFMRADDRVIKNLLVSNTVPTLGVSTAWDQTAGKPRKDLARAIEQISTAAPSIADGGSGEEYYGFNPNTICLHPGLRATLLDNDNVLKVYQGNIADQNPLLTGQLPEEIFGLRVIQSRAFPIDRVLVCERGTMGFYSDTWPLEFTPLYSEGGGPDGGPTQSFRSDGSHKRAAALDQPKAGLWLTGVVTP